jgi:hypothetical protein
MDIKTMTTEAYVAKLREQGVRDEDIPARVEHDLLVALGEQLQTEGVPPGFETLADNIGKVLAEDAKDKTAH